MIERRDYTFAWIDEGGERRTRTFEAMSDGDAKAAVATWLRVEGMSPDEIEWLTGERYREAG